MNRFKFIVPLALFCTVMVLAPPGASANGANLDINQQTNGTTAAEIDTLAQLPAPINAINQNTFSSLGVNHMAQTVIIQTLDIEALPFTSIDYNTAATPNAINPNTTLVNLAGGNPTIMARHLGTWLYGQEEHLASPQSIVGNTSSIFLNNSKYAENGKTNDTAKIAGLIQETATPFRRCLRPNVSLNSQIIAKNAAVIASYRAPDIVRRI